jgi:dihydroorotate dehydrogenase (NAD+) catalytic subunit
MSKTDLFFNSPIMNAAGILGFSADPKGPVDISGFGAFVTNPVSWTPRTPAKGVRYLPFSGGFLLHTGYPNPGLLTVLRGHAQRWARSPVPVIVHLLAQDAITLGKMVQRLEGVDGVMGVEIGLLPDIDPSLAHDMIQAAIGELAVIVRLPYEAVAGVNGNTSFIDVLIETGASAISLAPPRGALAIPEGNLISGRLYGPALFPQVLAVVVKLAEFDLPVIAAGGVYSQKDAETLLAAGATAVQLDAVLWRSEPVFYF